MISFPLHSLKIMVEGVVNGKSCNFEYRPMDAFDTAERGIAVPLCLVRVVTLADGESPVGCNACDLDDPSLPHHFDCAVSPGPSDDTHPSIIRGWARDAVLDRNVSQPSDHAPEEWARQGLVRRAW